MKKKILITGAIGFIGFNLAKSFLERKKTITIMEPEGNVHPALQADLADLFALTSTKPYNNQFIIETHSEHLILRFLRLIRLGKLDPNDIEITYQLGVAYKELGIYEEASYHFEEYIHQNKNDGIAFFLLGTCYLAIKDYTAALLAFQKSNLLIPNDYKTLYNIGCSYTGLYEEADAALKFREALKINLEDPYIYYALGQSYHKLNKKKKVREILDILYMLDRELYSQLSVLISGR